MKLLRLFLVLLLSGISLAGYCQVGIGTKSPDNSAALHIKSASKGLLIPEITDLPSAPKEGLLFYDPIENKYMFYDSVNWQVINPMPLGGIIMWSGSEIPYGWALCDGNYYSLEDHTLSAPTSFPKSIKTPDLRNRFIMGSDPAAVTRYNDAHRSVIDTTVTLQEENIPSHDHEVSRTSGAHSHTVTVTIGSDTHNHGYNTLTNREKAQGGNDRASYDTHGGRTDFTTTDDTHNHTASTTVTSNGGHSHGSTTSWGGDRGTTRSFDILPPYYTLAFIMRIK